MMKSSFPPSLRRRCLRLLAPLALLAAAALPAAAAARGPYSVEVLVDGVPLAEYASGRTSYVEAIEDCEYSIRLSNHTGRRIAVALAVDGLNSIDAKRTTPRRASKWILGPYERITVEGWQTGSTTARRFFFTTEEKSYGAWLGKTRNLGIISAAVFREKRPKPVPIDRPYFDDEFSGKRQRRSAPLEEGAAGPAPGRPAPELQAGEAQESESKVRSDLAATGIGREIDHRVRRVRFEAEPSPAAMIEIRYEYGDALARLGIFPRPWAYREDPLQRRERARGFEGFGFAPDPYR